MPSIDRQRRRRAGIPKNNKHARAVPPAAYQGGLLDLGLTNVPVVAAVVVTARVPVPFEAPVIVTEDVTPQVAGLVAFAGVVATAQVRLTAPVNPFAGGIKSLGESQ
jgi:hypothetical protein